MVTAKERYYYTWRPRQDGKYDCNKWDALGDDLVETYVVDPFFGGWRGECSCPAWTTCKHIKQLHAYLQNKDAEKPELHLLKWDEKNGWKRISL